jgi:hypothetical protein
VPVVVALGVGLSLGAVGLLVMAFAERHHHGAGVVARVLAALSLGSAPGGLLNGAVDWRTAPGVRLPAGALGLTLLAAGLAPGLGALTVAVACAGFLVAPALTTSCLTADAAAPPGFRTQADAWVQHRCERREFRGDAAGAGLPAGRLPLGLCFTFSGTPAPTAATLVCAGNARTPRPDADAGHCAGGAAGPPRRTARDCPPES